MKGDWLLVIGMKVSRLRMILFNEGRKHLICASPSSATVYAKPQDVTWEKVSQKKTSLDDGLWLPIKFSLERQRPCESPKLLDNCVPRAFCVSLVKKQGMKVNGIVAIMRRSWYFFLVCMSGSA